MKVLMVMEGNHSALRIEPEDEEGRALLAAYGVMGTYQAKLGTAAAERVNDFETPRDINLVLSRRDFS